MMSRSCLGQAFQDVTRNFAVQGRALTLCHAESDPVLMSADDKPRDGVAAKHWFCLKNAEDFDQFNTE